MQQKYCVCLRHDPSFGNLLFPEMETHTAETVQAMLCLPDGVLWLACILI